MDENFEIKFQNIFATIAEMYDKNPSTFLFELWFSALDKFEIEAIDRAFSIHVQDPDNGKFMPKPADIIRIIEGTTKDSAYNAWSMVDKAIGRVGSYESVVFDNPIIHRVIQDMGGWIRICGTEEKEKPFMSAEFINRYKGFKASGEIPEYPKKLIGLIEGENSSKGFFDHIPEPVLIGDIGKAKEALRLGTNRPSLMISRYSGSKQIEMKPFLKVIKG